MGMTIDQLGTLVTDISQAQKAKFAEFDEKIAGMSKPDFFKSAIGDLQADIEKTVKQLIPASILSGLHREASPEIEKRTRMTQAWGMIATSADGRSLPSIAQRVKDFGYGSEEATMKALGISVGANGGFLIPDELLNEIVFLARNFNFMAQLIRIIPNSAPKFELPKEGTDMTFYRGKTGQVPTASAMTVNQVGFTLAELTGIVLVSNVLLKFSRFDISSYINEIVARDLSDKHLTDWWSGSGSNEPTGVTKTAGVNTATQAGAHLNEDDIDAAMAAHPTKYMRGNGVVWVGSKNVLSWVSRLKDAMGAYIFFNAREGRGKGLTNSGQPEQNMAGYLKGFAAYEHPNAPDTELWLVSLDRYWAPNSGQVEIAVSTDYQFAQNQTAFRIWLMDDGQLTIAAAATKLGSITQ
jgi:HK97 family phage major capsid protein